MEITLAVVLACVLLIALIACLTVFVAVSHIVDALNRTSAELKQIREIFADYYDSYADALESDDVAK